VSKDDKEMLWGLVKLVMLSLGWLSCKILPHILSKTNPDEAFLLGFALGIMATLSGVWLTRLMRKF